MQRAKACCEVWVFYGTSLVVRMKKLMLYGLCCAEILSGFGGPKERKDRSRLRIGGLLGEEQMSFFSFFKKVGGWKGGGHYTRFVRRGREGEESPVC